jgi:pimeloyl-ACP methyl ester carboxylesterase
MSDDRIHRATSADGTQIVGRLHGDGPPLVLVPGGPGDGEWSFRDLIPHLTGSVTCHAMSTRGKGLSAGHPDHSAERLTEDVVAYVESIGEPVALFGHSSGAMLAIDAAARTNAVRALAVYEPAAFDVLDPAEVAAAVGDVPDRIAAALDQGRLEDAGRTFFVELAQANDEELPVLEASGIFARSAPNLWSVLDQVRRSGLPRLSRPDVPSEIGVPTLLVHGERTTPFFVAAVEDLARRLPDARVAVVPGAGHLGPQLNGAALAAALDPFLSEVTAAA